MKSDLKQAIASLNDPSQELVWDDIWDALPSIDSAYSDQANVVLEGLSKGKSLARCFALKAAVAIGIEKNKILDAAERGFPLDSDHIYSYVRELIRISIANRRELRNVRSLLGKIIAAPAAGLINRGWAVILLETKFRK